MLREQVRVRGRRSIHARGSPSKESPKVSRGNQFRDGGEALMLGSKEAVDHRDTTTRLLNDQSAGWVARIKGKSGHHPLPKWPAA